jgi:hypothetical protein
VQSQVSKHLAFAWQPTDRVFAHTLNVFPIDTASSFCALQSRVHEVWARLLSSEFGSSSIGAVLRYAPSDCFETFPFPDANPRAAIPALEASGQRVYDARAKYMLDENVGLTTTYNRLKDPACTEARIVGLRRLHEEMDRAVLDAYGWGDIDVPPYCPASAEELRQVEAFGEEVIDRLFVLNAKRAEEEKLRGVSVGAKQRGGKRGGGKKSGGGAPDGQGELRGVE